MNARQGYQLPPTPELCLNDMAPLIVRSVSANSLAGASSSLLRDISMVSPRPVVALPQQQQQQQPVLGENARDRLMAVVQDALSLFDGNDDNDNDDLFA